jgi:hypothetical protein
MKLCTNINFAGIQTEQTQAKLSQNENVLQKIMDWRESPQEPSEMKENSFVSGKRK